MTDPSPSRIEIASASIVIPTYNRRRTLARTLQGLLSQTSRAAFEVVVVDDCSSDDTERYMREIVQLHPHVKYLRHHENQGRVATRNDGIKFATGDVTILLDDDNVPEPGFVDAHLLVHDQGNGQRLATMGNVRYAAEVIKGRNFGRFLQSRYLGERPPKDRAGIDFHDLPSRCFGTLNCSARKSDLIAVGLFDPRFRYYGGEDEDMGHSLRRSGVRIVFAQDARSVHHDEVSIPRHKTKLMESARHGVAVLRDKSPDYIATTKVAYLLPIDRRTDSVSQMTKKVAVGLLCAGPIGLLLEWWAMRSDGIAWLYFPPLYRFLTAFWVYHGYRQSAPDRWVEYAESREAPTQTNR